MKSKIVEIEGRKFRFEFYTDSWGILWTSVYEIYREKKNFFDHSYEKQIGERWGSEDPVELGYEIVKETFEREKLRKEMYRKVDEFCSN